MILQKVTCTYENSTCTYENFRCTYKNFIRADLIADLIFREIPLLNIQTTVAS